MDIQPNQPASSIANSSIAGSLRAGGKNASDASQTNDTLRARRELQANEIAENGSINQGDQAGQRGADGRQLSRPSQAADSDQAENDVDPTGEQERPNSTNPTQRLDYRA